MPAPAAVRAVPATASVRFQHAGRRLPVAPVRVFGFEPPEARQLAWLPLAVRFKLDACGVRLRLHEWRALTMGQRRALLSTGRPDAFRALLHSLAPAAAAVADCGPREDLAACPPELEAAFPGAARRWAQASAFERYLAGKIAAAVPAPRRGAALAELGPHWRNVAHVES